MWRILESDEPQDFVIATGETHSLRDFVAAVFQACGLDWHDHVVTDRTLYRPSELREGCGDASKAESVLGWCATKRMHDVARSMVEAEERLRHTSGRLLSDVHA